MQVFNMLAPLVFLYKTHTVAVFDAPGVTSQTPYHPLSPPAVASGPGELEESPCPPVMLPPAVLNHNTQHNRDRAPATPLAIRDEKQTHSVVAYIN